MNPPSQSSAAPPRERGYLLIADMESSTKSKFVLGELDAFNALSEHNRTVMQQCTSAAPVPGIVLNSLGDAVVVKFPAADDRAGALASCIAAARAIIAAFEQLEPVPTRDGRVFYVRTKLLLQSYDAFCYGRRDAGAGFADELVGADIDLAFRLAPVSWRLQALVTEAFLEDLLAHSEIPGESAADTQTILDRAHVARHAGALGPGPLEGIAQRYRVGPVDYWVSDAREIGRLKGIEKTRQVFAVTFESPAALASRGEQQRLTIKVRQDHHAVILASIALGGSRNENYIEHVVDKLRDAVDGHRLDSELTLLAAAKVYGEFDFFFRVSSIDDESLRRFFNAIRADSFGVSHVEVRATVANRFAVTRRYPAIFNHYANRRYEIVLTWFEPLPGRDLFAELKQVLGSGSETVQPVELLEVGEVIHHTPVYAIFVCDSLRDYAAFFATHSLRPTGCRSHVGHVDRASDAQLRYSLLSGVYLPRFPGADQS